MDRFRTLTTPLPEKRVAASGPHRAADQRAAAPRASPPPRLRMRPLEGNSEMLKPESRPNTDPTFLRGRSEAIRSAALRKHLAAFSVAVRGRLRSLPFSLTPGKEEAFTTGRLTNRGRECRI